MNREEASALWIEYVQNELDREKSEEMTAFLKNNPDLKEEFEALGSLWNKMDSLPVPEPTSQMDLKFQAMLSGYEIAQSKKFDFISSLNALFQPLFESKMALASMMLFIGLGIGYLLSGENPTNQQLSNLNVEVYEMKKMMMLTLLEQPKAMDRMKAVQISNEIIEPDEKIVKALLKTLNNDTNVNVRLVAAQSLAGLANNPIVRSGLLQAISNQTSPVIQNALADIMIDLMEKNAVGEFEKLLQQQDLDTLVKEKIKTTLETLI